MMGGVSPETCWAIKKHWSNKFYYKVASCLFFLWVNNISMFQLIYAELAYLTNAFTGPQYNLKSF